MQKVSEILYQAAEPYWEKCLNHPFVVGIGDGTLDEEKFRFYMLQDYLYLFDYAKVFALGVVKARDPELMRAFAKDLAGILDGEMDTHRAYMKRLGVTEEQVLSGKPSLSNTSYTHYMLAVAQSGSEAEIVAALLSCSWSYADIGQKLGKIPGAAQHPFFGKWVSDYSSEGYAQMNTALVALMDKLAEGVDEKQIQHLTEIFVNCTRYELGFWDMAWEMRL